MTKRGKWVQWTEAKFCRSRFDMIIAKGPLRNTLMIMLYKREGNCYIVHPYSMHIKLIYDTLKKVKFSIFNLISLQVGCFEGVDHNREEEEEATPQSSSPGINFLSLCELLFIPAPILF